MESYFLFPHHHHSILPQPTEITSHLAEEILISHWEKKSQTTLSELFWHEADVFQLQHIATPPPALSAQPGNGSGRTASMRTGGSAAKANWFGFPKQTGLVFQ